MEEKNINGCRAVRIEEKRINEEETEAAEYAEVLERTTEENMYKQERELTEKNNIYVTMQNNIKFRNDNEAGRTAKSRSDSEPEWNSMAVQRDQKSEWTGKKVYYDESDRNNRGFYSDHGPEWNTVNVYSNYELRQNYTGREHASEQNRNHIIERYKRELNKNYLLLSCDNRLNDDFQTAMLIVNPLFGLLKLGRRRINDKIEYSYEITSKQSLERMMEFRSLNSQDIINLVKQLYQVSLSMEEYLLSTDHLLLTPRYIYVSSGKEQIFFCFYPGQERNIYRQLKELFVYFLDKVDYKNRKTVALIYELHRISMQDDYCMSELVNMIEKEYTEMAEEENREDEEEGIEEENNKAEKGKEQRRISTGLDIWADSAVHENRTGEKCADRANKVQNWVFTAATCLIGIVLLIYLTENIRKSDEAGKMMTAGFIVLCLVLLFTAVNAKASTSVWRGINLSNMKNKEEWEIRTSEKESADIKEKNDIGKKNDIEQEKDVRYKKAIGKKKEVCIHNHSLQNAQNVFSALDSQCIQETSLLEEQEFQKTGYAVLVSQNKEEIPDIFIRRKSMVIGCMESLVDYPLKVAGISRIHMKIFYQDDRFWVEDLNSTNGTFINGRCLLINQPFELEHEDVVQLAGISFVFRVFLLSRE